MGSIHIRAELKKCLIYGLPGQLCLKRVPRKISWEVEACQHNTEHIMHQVQLAYKIWVLAPYTSLMVGKRVLLIKTWVINETNDKIVKMRIWQNCKDENLRYMSSYLADSHYLDYTVDFFMLLFVFMNQHHCTWDSISISVLPPFSVPVMGAFVPRLSTLSFPLTLTCPSQ